MANFWRTLVAKADQDGEVKIEGEAGRVFIARPESGTGSPLDVEGVDLGVTTSEIVEFVEDGRKTYTPRN